MHYMLGYSSKALSSLHYRLTFSCETHTHTDIVGLFFKFYILGIFFNQKNFFYLDKKRNVVTAKKGMCAFLRAEYFWGFVRKDELHLSKLRWGFCSTIDTTNQVKRPIVSLTVVSLQSTLQLDDILYYIVSLISVSFHQLRFKQKTKHVKTHVAIHFLIYIATLSIMYYYIYKLTIGSVA